MSSYYREQGYHSRKRFLRRLRYVWAFLLLDILIIGGLFAYDAVRQAQKSDEASAPSQAETSLIVASTQLQSSAYFQFQSPKKWKAIANETRSNHFVYRQYNGPLIEQELIIDINKDSSEVLALTQTTRVLPVRASAQGKLSPASSLSDHCKAAVKPGVRSPVVVTYKQVTFNCTPDGTNFVAVVGLVEGTDSMTLTRPSGSTAKYNITYKNLTAQPTAGDFDNIIETFETR